MVLGQVVENNNVWCVVGVKWIILLMVLLNFMFSIWFVLFIIRMCSVFSDMVFFCKWFSRCFGVVIMICGVCWSELCCVLKGCLLYKVRILVFGRKWVRWCNFLVIWFVSFCVGYSINVCVWNRVILIWCKSLRLNVVVLLLLVLVCICILLFVRMMGNVVVWIGVILR